MSKFSIKLIVFIIISLFSCSGKDSQKPPPKAIMGILDLRTAGTFSEPSQGGWDFEKDGTINLDGEWEFYWKEFCDPDMARRIQTCLNSTNTNYITIPGEWNNFLVNGEKVGGKGYATYHLKVLLPKDLNIETIGIKMNNIGTAYELWVGNQLYGKAGIVSEIEDTAEAGFNPKLFWLRKESFIEEADSKTLDIVIKVSNYHDTSGGIWYSLKLGDYQTLIARDKWQAVIDFFLFGSICIMGFYHFGLYFLRKKDSSAFWFGMYCLAINLRILVTGEKYLESFFPDFHSILLFLEYLDFVLLVPIFANFLNSLYPEEINRKVKKGIIWTGLVFTLPILFLPSFYYSKIINAVQLYIILSCIYSIYVIIQAILNKRMGAKIFLAGFVFFFLIIVHDILYFHFIIRTIPLLPFGLFGFIFSQAATLSLRFSGAFAKAEEYSSALSEKTNRLEETSTELFTLTQNLEIKIQERTKDLEETKKEIEEMNAFAHIVNSLSDLNSIFIEISKYFYDRFGISGTWLFLPDEKKEYLYAYKAYSYNKLSEDKYNYMMNKKIPLKEIEGGFLYKTFQRKKPLYLQKIPKFNFEIDKEIVDTLHIKSYLYVPLTRKEECIGILSFSNLQEEMKLSKKEIHTITNLCRGIAGAVDTNHLLQQVEKTKQKIIELNQLIKALNELSNLEDIMQTIFLYILGKFHFPYYTITILDPLNNLLKHAHSYLPEDLTEKEKNILRSITLSLDISQTESLHIQAINNGKPIFIQDANTAIKTEKGKYLLSVLKHKSFAILPIILQNRPIGTLELFSQDKVDLSEEDVLELSFLSEQLAGIINGSLLMNQIQEEKEKSIVSQIEIEMQKKEIEKINEIVKKINSESELNPILSVIFRYMEEEFSIDGTIVMLKDDSKNELYTFNTSSPRVEPAKIEFSRNLKVPLNEKEGGILYKIFLKKKSFYLPKIDLENIPEGLIGEVIGNLEFRSFLAVPLVIQNNPFGLILLTSYSRVTRLSKAEIQKIENFCEHITGAIYNSLLLKQTEETKKEIEKQKRETEDLNNLIKSLNEELDLKVILPKVLKYVNENFGVQYYALYTLDKEKYELAMLDANFPDFLIEEDRTRVLNFKIPIQNVKGSHAFPFKAKRPFFIPRIRKTGGTQEENLIGELYKISSIFILPLILNNEIIGTIDFSSEAKMQLSKSDITKLSILGEQLAGIIHGSNLLKLIQEEKEKADIARKETEGLNALMRNINSVSSLVDIMSFIMYYLEKEYNFKDFYLLINEESENKLMPFSFTSSRHKEDVREYFIRLELEHNSLQGVVAEIFETKKPIFVEKENISEDDWIAKNWMEKGEFDYLFILPLVIYDELIGILLISSPKSLMFPDKEVRFKLERFSDLIAGSIYNARLLRKVEEAKEIAINAQKDADTERLKSEKLLLNILPKDVATELKEKGFAEPVLFSNVSVMFTDFKGFTTIAENLSPQELIKDLDACFVQFDKISERYNLEKLKTIGDSYMCAGGIPKRNSTHEMDCCLAALEIQSFMNMMRTIKEEQGFPYWELRLGIHTGPLIAGVIGEKKFAYDVWGDTVNTASRMESSGTPGKINISYSTYEAVKNLFECEYRGEVSAKNKGVVKMYYLNRIKAEFSKDEEGLIPNGKFWEIYGS